MVIDRVEFGESSWNKLSKRVLKLYFNYVLDNFILREEKGIESALFNDDVLPLHNWQILWKLISGAFYISWKHMTGYGKGPLAWNGVINV